MKKKNLLTLVGSICLALVLAALLIPGCAKEEAPPAPTPAKPAPAPAPAPAPPKPAAPEVVNIGCTAPLSGGAAKYGAHVVQGLTMAVEEINAAGGFEVAGKKYILKLTAMDDRYKPAETVTNARRMLTTLTPKPPIIHCPHSGGILAMEKFNEEEGFIIAAYTDNRDPGKQGNKLMVNIVPPSYLYAYNICHNLWDEGCRKLVLMTGTHEAGKINEELFEKVWERECGGEVVANVPIDYTAVTDFYPYLTKALVAKPDWIFLYGPSEPAAMIVEQSRELGYEGRFGVGAQTKIAEMLPIIGYEKMEGTIGTAAWEPLFDELPQIKAFWEEYHLKYPKEKCVTSESLFHFEYVWSGIKAMKIAGTVSDVDKIRAAWPKIFPIEQEWFTTAGSREVTPNGEYLTDRWGVKVSGGKLLTSRWPCMQEPKW